MQAFMLALIGCVTLDDFVVKLFRLPAILRFLPEAMSAVAVLWVLVAGTRDRFRLVAPKYWLTFAALGVVLLCGIINGAPGVGPTLSGSRMYMRALPLFFLPAVLPLTEVQLKRQLKWLLVLALVQAPISIYQRWTILSEQRFSGDDVIGTLMDSGILTLFLVCVASVLTGMFLRRRIGPWWYALLVVLVLVPTSIDETKVTVFFLPLGLLVSFLVGAAPGKRLRYFAVALTALIAIGALFVPVYNAMEVYNPYANQKDITAFFTNEKDVSKYLSSGVSGVGTNKDVRRADAIIVPFEFLAKDPVRLAFGLGLGAVSPSNFGANFEGSYHLLFDKFLITSFTYFLLEFGILGLLLIAVLFWLVWTDTLTVARHDNTLIGAVAVGWTGVVAVFALDVFYTNFHEFTSVTYLYWYFSGLICARCVTLAYESRTVGVRAVRPQPGPGPSLGVARHADPSGRRTARFEKT